MSAKEIKILHLLEHNSRITSKQIGSVLKISQQSASYLLHKVSSEKYFLRYSALIDSAKFGLIRVLVFYNYLRFSQKKKILSHLKHVPFVSSIEECSYTYDLLVEFTVPNLSFFNKENKDILHEFKDSLRQMAVYPIIVKHHYFRKYLSKLKLDSHIVTAGDRDIELLSLNEKKYLKAVQSNSRLSLKSLADVISCDVKTVVQLKKMLDEKQIIRKYTISLNSPLLGIQRTHVFISLFTNSPEDIDAVLEFLKQDSHVISAQKIIGNFELLFSMEHFTSHMSLIHALREKFAIRNYILLFSENIIKEDEIPISL